FEESLRNYVRGGGSVLIALGSVSATLPEVPVLGETILESNYSTRSRERFQMAASLDIAHPSVQKTNGFEGVKFYQTIRVDPGEARVVGRLSDQTPLLLEKKLGDGRVFAFTSTFDNVANDLPLHASFVPFVEQTAQYLSGVDSSPAHYTVGSHVDLRSARDRRSGVEVIGPDGNRKLSLAEAANLESYQLPIEGFYELRRANGRNELVAAHADRRESDLAAIPDETLALWNNTGRGEGAPAGSPEDTAEQPLSLWWYAALMLLAVTIAESVLGSRYLKAEREPLGYRKAA
ncbi:MAG: vWA domain-containing protein, partial [Bryobacteraceae bacterium]